MSSTNYLTNQGRLLLASMLSGQSLVYTRMESSDAIPDRPEQAQSLSEVRQSIEGISAEQQGASAAISGVFSCVSLEESYTLRVIGLYAKIEGQDSDILYSVTVLDDDSSIAMTAKKRAEYSITVYDSIANGSMEITVSDSASAPYSHVGNPYRHLFIQTNSSSQEAVVDSGSFNDFRQGQEIVFVPSVDHIPGSTRLNMAGKRFGLAVSDVFGNPIAESLSQHRPYVMTYKNGSFVHTDTSMLKVIDGVAHYRDSEGWHTLEPAGKIIASCSSAPPPDTLLCDGRLVNSAEYPELYDAIGNTYGGSDDSFRLPNLSGSFIRGVSPSVPAGTVSEATLAESEEGYPVRSVSLYYYIHTGKVLI